VVKVIWHKIASPPQTDGLIVFAMWRQCALPCGHIGDTWRIRLNLCMHPLALIRVHNPSGKSIGSAVSAHLTAESPYTLQWATLFPKIVPFHVGIWTPSNSWLLKLSQSEPTIQTAWRSVSCFRTGDCRVSLLYNGRPFPPNCLFPWVIWTPI